MTATTDSKPLDEMSPGNPVTAIAIDGNSIMAAVVSLDPSGVALVHATRTIELDGLVERVGRAVHPIFMDVDYLEYPDPEKLQRALGSLLHGSVFDNPIVGVFPADAVHEWREEGSAAAQDHRERINRGMGSYKSPNPYAYPRLLSFEESILPDGNELLRIWNARFDDVLVTAERFYALKHPFQGLITGRRALEEVASLITKEHQELPITLIDVGKLRTTYVGALGGRLLFCHSIPVGLARDDIHYFKAIKPVLEFLEHINEQTGTLLFPPDTTPSPIFDPKVSTPQVDCTRFTMQIARYGYRVLHDIWKKHVDPGDVVIYLTGRSSRLPGFRPYIEEKTAVRLRRIDRRPIPGIQLLGDVGWPEFADHLLPIGAAIAFHRRKTSRFGMVLRDRRPIHLNPEQTVSRQLMRNALYVLESPHKNARRPRSEGGGALD